MKTQTKPDQEPLLQEIADKLMLAHREIDELAVQLALGKAEAADKFEEIKKEFRSRLQELKAIRGSHMTNIGKLEVQLTLGKADDKASFEVQKGKILAALDTLGKEITSSGRFQHEAEKFRLKMEVLQLVFALKKLQIKDSFRDQMATARKKIEMLTGSTREKVAAGRAKYRDFSDEVQLAYQHLRKAIGVL